MSQACALYRHWDAEGRLLYVGISNNPVRRLTDHMRSADWRYNGGMERIWTWPTPHRDCRFVSPDPASPLSRGEGE